MTRKEGILLEWLKPSSIKKQALNNGDVLEFEYNNYCELCDYCHEKPKTMYAWLNETINPLKS